VILEGIPDTMITAAVAIVSTVVLWKVTHTILRIVALLVAAAAVAVGYLLYTGVLTL
jgi:hypothetical protein